MLFSLVSIIKFFILYIFLIHYNSALANSSKVYAKDAGTLSIMYHRFDENKYPSTNIQISELKKQFDIIKKNGLQFYYPDDFDKEYYKPKKKKKILITIDDAFSSFYEKAWPYLKTKEIPFILFVSTKTVGNKGYMSWEQIKEIEKYKFGFIGNHSHSHDYLINYSFKNFKKDIDLSIKILKNKIGYNPIFYSHPFGEYSLEQINYIKKKFKYAFGQHSGLIDINKDKFELPRFPINEKYGDLERFSFLVNLKPLQYKNIIPEDKFLRKNNNPPKLNIEFFQEQDNLENLNCYSNEGSGWRKSKIDLDNKILKVKFEEKFLFRRGRINCSLKDKEGWRWLGLQFSVDLD
tara:strand:- start:291 stop:1337 length:1047 start_codon:yes stop_codon:yes gene_type:complete